MNGMEMLVNAALKATGFSREQLDDSIKRGKEIAADADKRLSAVESDIAEILALLKRQAESGTTPSATNETPLLNTGENAS